MSEAPFGSKIVVGLTVLCVVSFLTSILWGALGPEVREVSSAGPDGFSRSALGHSALVELLRELGTSVIVSRFDSGGKAGENALLVLAEPDHELEIHGLDAYHTVMRRAGHVLLVLPKWSGVDADDGSGFIAEATLHSKNRVHDVLEAFHIGNARVVRPKRVAWGGRPAPLLIKPQLIQCPDVDPIFSAEEGILFGRVRVRWGSMFVLSDPDLLSNHGLDNDHNALIAMRMLDRARRRENDEDDLLNAIVIDETLHGHGREPSLTRALFRFPLVLATLQALLTVAVLLWAAMARFGAPVAARRGLAAGKEFLIENVASLLRFGGQSAHVLKRYLQSTATEVARRLHAPTGSGTDEMTEWLDHHGASRGVEDSLRELRHEVKHARNPSHVLYAANRIHAWKEEMIHGPVRHS